MELAAAHAALDQHAAEANAARAAAAAMQEHLETQLQEALHAASTAQRLADDSAERRDEADARLSVLQRELLQSRAQSRALQAREAPDAAAARQIAALQNEIEEAHAKNRAAATAAAATAAQLDALQAQLRAANAVASDGAVAQLRRQADEAHALLEQKQAQLERVSADKGAQTMALERQLNSVRCWGETERRLARLEALTCAGTQAREQLDAAQRQTRAYEARESATRSANDDIVPLDSLGDLYSRFASNRRFAGAVKTVSGALDSSAATLVTLLRRRPVARLGFFLYLGSLHLFIWLLIGALQRKALRQDDTQHAP